MDVIRKWKRQRAANEVVRLGQEAQRLGRQLYVEDRDPYFDYLVAQKRTLEHRRDKLIAYLKETA